MKMNIQMVILLFVTCLTVDVEACLRSDGNIAMESLKDLKEGSCPVSFFIACPRPLIGTVKKILYTDVILNNGDGFWLNISRFVAPVKGVYQFFISFQTCDSSNATSWKLNVNDEPKAVCWPQRTSGPLAETMCTYMTKLKRRHSVTVSQDQGCAWANVTSRTITFSGTLVK